MELAQTLKRIGRLSFMLMWLPFIGIFIGLIGMPDGSYSFAELPEITRISLVLTGICIAGSIIGQIGGLILGGAANQALLEKGREAEATILEIAQTGTMINNNPVVRMKLEVRPPDEPAFGAEAERLVPLIQIPQIQPGATVQVRYDSQSRAVALVDADGIAPKRSG